MRHSASLTVTVPGDVVRRDPTSWERVKRFFLPASMAPDLTTEERQLDRNVVSLTEGICAALRELEVNDAVYLAIDGRTVYHDPLGVPNDVERLLEAAQSDALRGEFSELRAVFTQQQEGLELLYEATFQRRFPRDTPTAFVSVSARLYALHPHPGETPLEAQARLRVVLGEKELATSLRDFFDQLVDRLRESLGRAFPEGSVARGATASFVLRPSRKAVRELSRRGFVNTQPSLRAQPGCYHRAGWSQRYYDPFDCYYDDHGMTWAALVALGDLLDGVWQPAQSLALDIVDTTGALLCPASQAGTHLELFAGISDLATQDFMTPDLPSIDQCISELPDPGAAFEAVAAIEIPLPDLSALPHHVGGFAGDAMNGILDVGSHVGSAVSDVASSAFDAASDFNPFD